MDITYQTNWVSNNKRRGAEKKDIVLKWIGCFDFCSIELLSALLKQPVRHTHLFFQRLIADGYLVRFKAENLSRDDLVRIGYEGVAYLKDTYGIDVRNKMRSDELARRKKIFHDYCLQLYIAGLTAYDPPASVLAEKSIVRGRRSKNRIPDGLIFSAPGAPQKWNVDAEVELPEEISELRETRLTFDSECFWVDYNAPVAVEIEISGKKKHEVIDIFRRLGKQMLEGKLSQVRFIFADEAVCRRYLDYFTETRWGPYAKVDLDHPLRRCFSFQVSDFSLEWLLMKEHYDVPDYV
ncbi:MAG: hypothetical protein EOP04_04320 [Proteobacteria bacterium]|nr:MAG: hypothetical protein EOP04_04320 [Pseudomonadota bacterium]